MFHTARATSFSLPTTPCGGAKPWAAISSSSTPFSTSTISTPAAPPSQPHLRLPPRPLTTRTNNKQPVPGSASILAGVFLCSGRFQVSAQDSVTMLRGGPMSKSRRDFLTHTSLGLIGAAVASSSSAQHHVNEIAQEPTQLPPGAPPAFGTGPAVGPDVSPATFAEAEKLVQVNLSTADRALAAETWRVNLASVYERRSGPRTIALEPTLAPFSRYHSVLPGQVAGPQSDQFIRTKTDPGPLPASDADIAFASVTQLSRWIEQRKLTSERLTQIYLRRIEQFDPKLRCIITLTRDLALAQAKKADEEIAAGKYRG